MRYMKRIVRQIRLLLETPIRSCHVQKRAAIWVLLPALFTFAGTAWAVDGVIEINHARALAGGVTGGDTPGYPISLTAGSYRLTGDLVIPTVDDDGLHVGSFVTLDLNGFAIRGPSVCNGSGSDVSCTPTGAGTGIRVSGDHITIRDGLVTGAGGTGIGVFGSTFGLRVEDVRIVGNAGRGISVIGTGTAVLRCVTARNGDSGLRLIGSGQVLQSQSLENFAWGAHLFSGASWQVRENEFRGNGNHGVLIQGNSEDSLVAGNVITANGGAGLSFAGSPGGYTGNAFGGNGGASHVEGGTNLGGNICDGIVCP